MILAETRWDMIRFRTAAHLAAWTGLAPGVPQSGRRFRSGCGTATVAYSMLVEFAGSVGRSRNNNFLSTQHARLMGRRSR